MTLSGIPDALRDFIWERDRGQCVCCGRRLVREWGAYSIQHRIPRGMGGTKKKPRACELVLLRGSATTGCHGHAEAHTTWAKDVGLRVPLGTAPDAWPVLWHGHTELLLTDDGWKPYEKEVPWPASRITP